MSEPIDIESIRRKFPLPVDLTLCHQCACLGDLRKALNELESTRRRVAELEQFAREGECG